MGLKAASLQTNVDLYYGTTWKGKALFLARCQVQVACKKHGLLVYRRIPRPCKQSENLDVNQSHNLQAWITANYFHRSSSLCAIIKDHVAGS